MKFSKQPHDVHLIISLCNSFLYFLAIAPFGLKAQVFFNPPISRKLYILKEIKLFLKKFISILIKVKNVFCHHELVAILVKRTHKICQTPDNECKQPTRIREHLIDFTDPSVIDILVIGEGKSYFAIGSL